jgi:hypothetical protein
MANRPRLHRFLSTLAHAWMRGLISSGAPACAKILPPEMRKAASPTLSQTG